MKTFVLRFALATGLLCPFLSHAGDFSQRPDVQAFIHDLAVHQNFSVDELQSAFDDAQEIPRVVDLIKPPADPGVRSWQRYRPRFINSARVAYGVEFWRNNQQTLAEAEAHTGVPAEIIVGIIGVETIYGRNTGNFSTLSALTTLAFDYPPRADLFRQELASLFLLARDQGRDVRSYRGSYAGAIGLPQFLPSSIRRLALDGDHDGVIDLTGNPTDAIYSVANYLASYGWQRGGRVVHAAQIDDAAQIQPLLDAGLLPTLDRGTLQQAGVNADWTGIDAEKLALVDFVSPGSPTEYWLGFQNFYVITRYNHSSFYAMSVYELGRAVRLAFEANQEQMAGGGTSTPHPKPRCTTQQRRTCSTCSCQTRKTRHHAS
jgi:membrane-bound lytic murein transglycosylase B